MSTTITHIDSLSDLNRILGDGGAKLTVIDFHATWCGPCHQIAPKFEALSRQYTNVRFAKCDVDQAKDVAQKYSISAMPSFVFIKNGQKVDLVRGADPRGLENAIKRHADGSAVAFSGRGQTLGGSSSPGETPADDGEGGLIATWNGLDSQTRVILLLIGAYLGYVFFFA
ncbi:thioredoxin-domain-containing protein [Cantharellus anzutake]|uniref:thioredoxin-domain-containing protein n=1 Tax=Cantharellus anzutake TaxID=1750568 RepID=UPI00190588A0|nr:thioredoxin-domain-containing protein [Cantharellus anzutake]KAF8333066.1 thioredoxin-domain-containing protein [Cantharellus anzutake]